MLLTLILYHKIIWRLSLEHAENVALALRVCKDVGVPEELALSGMLKTNPDPGALVIWNLNFKSVSHSFVNAFAANDPKSTLQIWKMLQHRINKTSTCIFEYKIR